MGLNVTSIKHDAHSDPVSKKTVKNRDRVEFSYTHKYFLFGCPNPTSQGSLILNHYSTFAVSIIGLLLYSFVVATA